MLEMALLGLLCEGEAQREALHGYELKRRLGQLDIRATPISFGALYPALRRMESNGLVEAADATGTTTSSTIPMTGSLTGELAALRARRSRPRQGRARKAYTITELGRHRLHTHLTDATDIADDRGFDLRLAFCRFLEPGQRVALFEARREAVQQRLSRHRDTRTGAAAPDAYVRALIERTRTILTHDLDWLDRLIVAEQRT